MKIYNVDGKQYRLPNTLSEFQFRMYVHLVNWKWANITEEPGFFRNIPYDLFLPDEFAARHDLLYAPIRQFFLDHQQKFPFKSHKFVGHMASSQAACANLFLPILKDPMIAASVLSTVKPDLKKIAVDRLDRGFRIEFWDEPDNMLGDHNKSTGTDVDIAIAYYDQNDDLNLWLIEHKLTEKEFSTCGGSRSKKRKPSHICGPASEIFDDRSRCYYHDEKKYRYWNIMLDENTPFDLTLIEQYDQCPFKGGMNQLWRNQLLAASLENSTSPHWPYKKVYFSVVHHPLNNSLGPSMSEFRKIVRFSDRFFAFSSETLINAAENVDDAFLNDWVRWYKELYTCHY